MGMYFVGIDGGGTSCRARIKDAQGNFIGEAKSGSATLCWEQKSQWHRF